MYKRPAAGASDRMAAAEVIFLFFSCLHPNTASVRSESSHGSNLMSRLSSRFRNGEPKALCASSGSRPSSMAWGDMRFNLFVDLAV